MKQQTPEIIIQNSEQEKNSKEIETLYISDFYKTYIKERKKYIDFPSKRKHKKVKILIFKKIIKEYLKIYFNDFYYYDKSIYFPFGGFLKKVLYPKWVKKITKPNTNKSKYEYKTSNSAIGLYWYLRPSKKMEFMVEIKKLTGNTNALPKIEANFLKTKSKDLIPIFTAERVKGKKHKTLYRNY